MSSVSELVLHYSRLGFHSRILQPNFHSRILQPKFCQTFSIIMAISTMWISNIIHFGFQNNHSSSYVLEIEVFLLYVFIVIFRDPYPGLNPYSGLNLYSGVKPYSGVDLYSFLNLYSGLDLYSGMSLCSGRNQY